MPTPVTVADQYTHYPYPEPGDDLPTWLQSFNYDLYDPGIYGALFWPEGRPKSDLDILVAGCGSMQAAVIAYQNPECRVTGIDFSPASIAHEERLRDRHKLANLTLMRMNLFDAPDLGRRYDLIISSGVVHHLPDPAQGVRALASVLEDEHGALVMMLYGRLGRIGIYPLQDVFRRLHIPQSPEGVQTVRSIIKRLPAYHPGRRYFEYSPEMDSDAAIVDTFLHPQDTAYQVHEVLALIEGNGLRFQSWLDAGLYNAAYDQLTANVSERDRWSIVESLTWSPTTHQFVVCKPERDRRSEISFAGEGWLAYVPQLRPTIQPSAFDAHKFGRDGVEFSLSPPEAVLFVEANGRRTITDILRHKALGSMPVDQRKELARAFYARMWRLGHMFFSLVSLSRPARRSDDASS